MMAKGLWLSPESFVPFEIGTRPPVGCVGGSQQEICQLMCADYSERSVKNIRNGRSLFVLMKSTSASYKMLQNAS